MSFSSDLDLSRVRILDGGLGSAIEHNGYDCSSTDAWSSGANITHPHIVIQSHLEFVLFLIKTAIFLDLLTRVLKLS